MKVGYYVVLAVLVSAQQAFSWGWHSRKKSTKAAGAITWHSGGFVGNNRALNESCNKVCTKHREQWTTQWKTSWHGGVQCGCKAPGKTSLFSRTNHEEKPHDVTYRSVGIFKLPEDLVNQCPKVCAHHDEKYTGNWDHKWIGGYRCECKPDASVVKTKIARESAQEVHKV